MKPVHGTLACQTMQKRQPMKESWPRLMRDTFSLQSRRRIHVQVPDVEERVSVKYKEDARTTSTPADDNDRPTSLRSISPRHQRTICTHTNHSQYDGNNSVTQHQLLDTGSAASDTPYVPGGDNMLKSISTTCPGTFLLYQVASNGHWSVTTLTLFDDDPCCRHYASFSRYVFWLSSVRNGYKNVRKLEKTRMWGN